MIPVLHLLKKGKLMLNQNLFPGKILNPELWSHAEQSTSSGLYKFFISVFSTLSFTTKNRTCPNAGLKTVDNNYYGTPVVFSLFVPAFEKHLVE